MKAVRDGRFILANEVMPRHVSNAAKVTEQSKVLGQDTIGKLQRSVPIRNSFEHKNQFSEVEGVFVQPVAVAFLNRGAYPVGDDFSHHQLLDAAFQVQTLGHSE